MTQPKSARWIPCAHCGQTFYSKPPWRGVAKRKFCSFTCLKESGHYEKMREAGRQREGENNPNYKHGQRQNKHIRSFSLKLKGEPSCRNCGALATDLHHVIPRSKHKASKGELLNGLPLCSRCHQRWHRGKRELFRDIFTDDEWGYLTSVNLTGQNILPWLDDHYPERPKDTYGN